jgi:hypothetical protein
MRKKTAKELAQKRAAKKAREAVKEKYSDSPYVHYGALVNDDGEELLMRLGRPGVGDEKYAEQFTIFNALCEQNPQAKYFNMFRLYEHGKAIPEFGRENDAEYESKTVELLKRIESEYDKAFPEHAEFVQFFIENVSKNVAEGAVRVAEAVEHETLTKEDMTGVLRGYIEEQRTRIQTDGSSESLLAFGFGKAFVTVPVPPGFPGFPKYRMARAVTEIATRVNAEFLVYGNEVWMRDVKTNERTGEEAVIAQIILPNAKVAVSGGFAFSRIKGPLTVNDVSVDGDHQQKQMLFGPWIFIPTTQNVAVA